MLDKFERIYSTNTGADSNSWKELFDWIKRMDFPYTSLPKNYILLMSESNGGDYAVGEREYQFLSLKEIPEYYGAYLFEKYMPFAFPFAMDGRGNFFVFSLKEADNHIYGVNAGNLGWEYDECFTIASSFSECLSQKNLI